jgi:hypothetical protein
MVEIHHGSGHFLRMLAGGKLFDIRPGCAEAAQWARIQL